MAEAIVLGARELVVLGLVVGFLIWLGREVARRR